MKARIGISFDQEVMDALEEQVRVSPDLALDRSEIVNVVMKAFFRAGLDHTARARELVIMNRNGRLKGRIRAQRAQSTSRTYSARQKLVTHSPLNASNDIRI